MKAKGEIMPEQQGPEQVGEGGIFSEIALVRNAFRDRLASEGRAEQLELQAAQIRDEAKGEHEGKWREAKTAIKAAAETGELAGRDLLEAVIDLRAITPAPKMPQRKPLSLMGQHGSIKQQTTPKVCQPLDKEGILTKFDAIKPGEPIMTDDKVGIVKSQARTELSDQLTALGAYLQFEVEFDAGKTTEIKKSIEHDLGGFHIGVASIQELVDKLYYDNKDRGHGLQNNLDKLKKIQAQLTAERGFEFDLTHLDRQIAAGERNLEFRRQQRSHQTRLERMFRPR
jgi:hypothetical protein